MTRTAPRGFDRTNVWIFDLDNTLYPAGCDLFAQVNHRMGEFIARYLDVPYDYAQHLRANYYRHYGTTLSGLMKVHAMKPEAFLDYVHDLDLSVVPEAPELSAAIGRLPGRKLIFTAGSRGHAERVAGKLGVLHHFEDIFDIVAAGYDPKPRPEPYARFLAAHGVDPKASAMFEDMPANLEQPHALGMTTVLVHAPDHHGAVSQQVKGWPKPPAHIHHLTEDLARFLDATTERLARPR